jgi:hypothetical protein
LPGPPERHRIANIFNDLSRGNQPRGKDAVRQIKRALVNGSSTTKLPDKPVEAVVMRPLLD